MEPSEVFCCFFLVVFESPATSVVLLCSSGHVLWSTKHHLTFNRHGGGGGDDDWIFISRWTYPLMQDRVAQGWISPMTLTWGQLWMRQPSVVHSGPELLLALCTLIQVLYCCHTIFFIVFFISQLLLLLSAIISFRKGMNYSSQKSALPLLCKAGSSKFGSCFNRPCSSGQGI